MTQQETLHSTTIRWSPTLAFANALAFAVLFVPLVLFKRFGLSNDTTTLLTSLLFMPWLLRPLAVRYLPATVRLRPLTAGLESVLALLLFVLAYALPLTDSVNTVVLLLLLASLGGVVHDVAMERYICDMKDEHQRTVFTMRTIAFLVAMAVCQGLTVALAGSMEVMTRTVRSSWGTAFYALAAVFLVLSIVNFLLLPGDSRGKPDENIPYYIRRIDRSTATIVTLLLLMLVPEALTLQVEQLFLIDAPHSGGLGLSPSEYGLLQGTVGVVALVVGIVVGLKAMRRWSVLKEMIAVATATTLPVGAYFYLSLCLSGDLLVIGVCVFIKQLSLGFGLSVLYRLLFERLQSRHLSTALIALPLLLVGTLSGTLQESVGYRIFFIAVLSVSPLVFAVVAVVNAIIANRR